MKLLVQSDDYGITPAVARGILYGIEHGVVRNTGVFTNMPWAEECIEWIRPYLDKIALGIDLNASTGSSLLGYDKVPSLCHEDGSFYTSRENRALDQDAENHDHVVYEEVYAEFEAQIEKFIELVGKKPDYIHGHAYGTATTFKASMDLAKKYDCLYSTQTQTIPGMKCAGMGWYQFGASPEGQLKEDLTSYIVKDTDGLLQHDYGYLITHCGWADKVLFDLSSFNLCRVKDLEALTSEEVKNWIQENHVELITYKDLPYHHKDLPVEYHPVGM